MNHIVFLNGQAPGLEAALGVAGVVARQATKALMTDEQLAIFDEASCESSKAGTGSLYLGARNADLPRFVLNRTVHPDDDAVVVTVSDSMLEVELATNPQTDQPWASTKEAQAYVDAQNANQPTTVEVFTNASAPDANAVPPKSNP